MASQASLDKLRIHLGPELRAVYPVVVNLGLSGDVELTGPLDPERVSVAGTINLDGGEVGGCRQGLVEGELRWEEIMMSCCGAGCDP